MITDEKRVTQKLDAVPGEVREFVSGLNRSRLGSFAMDEELLILAIMVLRYSAMDDVPRELSEERGCQAEDDLVRLLTDHGMPIITSLTLYGEALFWGERAQMIPPVVEHYELLSLAYRLGVDYHDYIAVGFTDQREMDKYREHGIDPQMALVLSEAVA